MVRIKLEQGVWDVDESRRLGPPGGFGEVFVGHGDHGEVAIKRLMITASAAAHRELNIGRSLSGRDLEHVVPVWDFGQDAESDRYYLVMPICEESLDDHLRREGNLLWEDAKPIIFDIIAGLREVGDIVHRDLKPGNVLKFKGSWRIADFGIAKFVEDSTSLETLREALTPVYAAPEQWSGLRPSAATDVYALGCIIHRVMNGTPPFTGSLEDIREGHLHQQPPGLTNASPRLSAMTTQMLRKAPAARPGLERVLSVLNALPDHVPNSARGSLAEAAREIAEQEAAEEARRQAEATARRDRSNLAKEATDDLERVLGSLFDQIDTHSDSTHREGTSITLGRATMSYVAPHATTAPLFGSASRPRSRSSSWDIVASSEIKIEGDVVKHTYYGAQRYVLSASLIYCTTDKDPEYRWREMSFWQFRNDGDQPYSLDPSSPDFATATSNVIGGTNVAHGPWTIDGEDEDDFVERWLGLFAKAVKRELTKPMQMPPPTSFFGR